MNYLMKKIELKIPGKTYPVYIGENSFDQLAKLINSRKFHKNIFFVVDRKVFELYSNKIKKLNLSTNAKIFTLQFDAAEQSKKIASCLKMYTALLKNEFGRDTLVIAMGGGITGDIAGYVASTFARGVQLVQIPTTLLASVDSSVGGKTGINFGETKNIIGTFYQPELVLIDTNFLKTLPEEELICGVGEILKYTFLTDQKFFKYINENLNKLIKGDNYVTQKIIEKCVRFKGDVVKSDENENSLRKILNFGHTFAHAIEVEQNYSIKHGQAVAIGLVCVLYLSNKIGLLAEEKFQSYLQILLRLKGKVNIASFDANSIYQIMKRDKKGILQKIKFVLLTEIGRLVIDAEADEEKVISAINYGMNCFLK